MATNSYASTGLEKQRVERLKSLVTTTTKKSKTDIDNVLFYNQIYNRNEDFKEYNKKKNGGAGVNTTNEQLDTPDVDYINHYKSPEPKVQIDRKASYLLSSIYPNEKALFRAGSDNLYSREKAYTIEKLLNKQIRDMEFRKSCFTWIKQGLIDGTTIMQVKWKYETEDTEDQQEMDFLMSVIDDKKTDRKTREEAVAALEELQQNKQLRQMTGEPPAVKFDGPTVEIIRRNNFHVDTGADSLANADVVVVEKWERLSKLKRLEKLGRLKNTDKINSKGSNSNGANTKDVPGTVQDAVTKGDAKLTDRDPVIKFYEIWEKGRVSILTSCYMLLDYRRKLFTDIDYPFIVFSNNPEANKFFGQSDYKTCENLIQLVDDYQRKMIDQWDKHLKGRTFLQGKNISDDNLLKRLMRGEPGVYKVRDIKGILEDRIPLFDAQVLQGKSMAENQIVRTIGGDNMIGGTDQIGSQFRTNDMLQSANSTGQIFTNTAAVMLASALKQLGRIMLKLNRQFLTEPQVFAYTNGSQQYYNQGDKMYKIIGASIPRDFDIDINIKVISDPIEQAEKAEMDSFMSKYGPSGFVRMDRGLTELASKYRGFQNPFDLIETDMAKVFMMDQMRAKSVGGEMSPGKFGPVSMQRAAPMLNAQKQPGGQQPQQSPLNRVQATPDVVTQGGPPGQQR